MEISHALSANTLRGNRAWASTDSHGCFKTTAKEIAYPFPVASSSARLYRLDERLTRNYTGSFRFFETTT